MNAFFGKVWSWILGHKLIAITMAAVLVVGTPSAIVLPIALHEHSYSAEWSSDAENHWHAATCKHDEEKSDLAAHTYANACDTTCDVCGYVRTVGAHVYDNACDTACNVCGATRTVEPHVYDNACDTDCNVCGSTRKITHDHADTLTAGATTHYYLCSVCGDKKDEAAHTFDKTVAHSDYLKAVATATTKAQYYKSCVCGKAHATDYFETDKTVATLTDIQDLSKTYDKVELATPTYITNSDGTATFEWYQGDTKLTAKPVNAGTYKVKVNIAESATYAGVSAEKEFTIAKKVLTNISLGNVTYKGSTDFAFVLSEPNGLLSGESFSLQVTTASKDVGSAVEIASISYTNNNYSIDKSAITLNIVPKELTMKSGITAITYATTYDGSVYKSHVGFDANTAYVAGIVAGDHIQVNFQTPSAAAGTYTNCITFDKTIRNNKNYDISALVFEFTIKPKDLDVSGVTFTKPYDGTDTITRSFTSADGLVDGDTFSIIAKMPSANVGVGADSTSTVNLNTLRNYTFNGQSALDYVKEVKASAEITQRVLSFPAVKYVAEYTGSSRLTIDLSEYAVEGDTLTMSFQAMRSVDPILPISAVGSYADVNFVKISYSDTVNYKVIFPTSGYSLEIVPKKISNLDIKITYDVYDNVYVTLLNKDGVVGDEIVKLVLGNNHLDLPVGTVLKLQESMAVPGEGYEIIAAMTGDNKDNYELVAYEDENGKMIYGTVTIVANCDVQFDGSCNCGTSHLTETLTFLGGEAVGVSATISCDSTYEGGIYKIALEGGKYEFLGSDQFFNISGIYDENGNKVADSIGTHVLPEGTYYFHVYVGSIPSSDTIWVKKTAKMLDAATMANAIVPDMEPGNSDAGVRIHNLQTHNGGDTFVLFYNVGENVNALGQSINFRYEDGDGGYSATSNIESIEFYDVNGIQLDVTYDEPDMIAASGVTAVGGVYIVVTMNGEGMDNLYFYAY